MSYAFTFDLTKLSQTLFEDIVRISEKDKLNEKLANMARNIVNKFNVDKHTGLPISDSITVIEDLIHVNMKNRLQKEQFLQTKKRALFLPHCCRRYMDARCKATFDTTTSAYICNHCSPDCQIHQATILSTQRNYDIYVLPGASCIRKIFQKHQYEGVIGVACTDELKPAMALLEEHHINTQGIPLIKNGCSDTRFNFETLDKALTQDRKTSIDKFNTTKIPFDAPVPQSLSL